jgi:phosphatidylglycerophosphate synthase
MGVTLSKKQLENIKYYKYSTNSATPVEKYFYNAVWDHIANHWLPDWLAPNLLTLLGVVLPLVMLVAVCVVNPSFNDTVPHWLLLLGFIANLWYQTIDAVDGKQARRTNNCSPLGQILDHNLDQISITAQMVSICSLLKLRNNITSIMLLAPCVFSAHYSIEYRMHFTKFHAYHVSNIGATEQLIVVELAHLIPYFSEQSNEWY